MSLLWTILGSLTPFNPQHSDDALLARYLDGDLSAFDALVDRHEGALMRYCMGVLGPARRQEAADVVQDVFLRVVEQAQAYAPSGAFRPWLFTIARNRCTDLLRRSGRVIHTASPPHETTPSQDPGPDTSLSVRQLQASLQHAIEHDLSPRQRQVFALHRAGLSYAEIGRELGISAGAVKYHIFEARERLRPALAGFMEV